MQVPSSGHRSRSRVDGTQRARSTFRVAGPGRGGQKGVVSYTVDQSGEDRDGWAVGMLAFLLSREADWGGGGS